MAGHAGANAGSCVPVSYTHLDVYKRQVTDRLLDYLKGQSASLDMEATIQGEMQPVFGERELLHMACLLYTSRCV